MTSDEEHNRDAIAACLTTLLPSTIFSRLLLSVMVMDAVEIVCIEQQTRRERVEGETSDLQPVIDSENI